MRWLVFLLSSGLVGAAPADSPLSGQTTELADSFKSKVPAAYSYIPIDKNFWLEIESQWQKSQNDRVISSSLEKLTNKKISDRLKHELKLALASSLRRAEYPYLSFLLLAELVIETNGTNIGEAALAELSYIAKGIVVDREAIRQLVSENDFGVVHEQVQSFISSYRYWQNRRLQHEDWAQADLARVMPDSLWRQELIYFQALEKIKNNEVETAEADFIAVLEAPQTSSYIREWAALQKARLLFERGQFAEALTYYERSDTANVREKGRRLLEQGWAHYYTKNYSQALGMLKSLRGPYYDSSLNPERYLLEALIFRELCNYRALVGVVKDFKTKFKTTLVQIRDRKPLHLDSTLLNMALANGEIQSRANLVDQIRKEQKRLSEKKWFANKYFSPYSQKFKLKDRTLQKEIDLDIEPRVRAQAEVVLDYDEQMQFLEYAAKLDSLRLRNGRENQPYDGPKVPHFAFDRLFWPVSSEYWWDEAPHYQVLLSSRCEQKSEVK